MTALVLSGVSLNFGGVRALDGVDVTFDASRITSLIGPNGAGKTSLVNIVTAAYRPTAGQVLWQGRDLASLRPHEVARRGIGRTFQNLEVFWTMSVLENVVTACESTRPPGFLACLVRTPAIVRDEAENRARAMEALRLAGLSEARDRPAGTLSYGHLKKLEIARALALQPRLLLLDEPAAGCNARETDIIADLILEIAARGIGIVLVEHDMKLVMNISDRIVVLDRGRIIADGAPRSVRSDPRVIEAYLGAFDTGHEATSRPAPIRVPQTTDAAQ